MFLARQSESSENPFDLGDREEEMPMLENFETHSGSGEMQDGEPDPVAEQVSNQRQMPEAPDSQNITGKSQRSHILKKNK